MFLISSPLKLRVVSLTPRPLYPVTHWKKNGWLKQQGSIGKSHAVFKWRPPSYNGAFLPVKPWNPSAKYLTFRCDKREEIKWYSHSSVTLCHIYCLLFCKISVRSIDLVLKGQGWPIGCPETSITLYRYTLHNVTGERRFRLFGGGSLRSRKMKEYYVTQRWRAC